MRYAVDSLSVDASGSSSVRALIRMGATRRPER
jgi:hypothetical protein